MKGHNSFINRVKSQASDIRYLIVKAKPEHGQGIYDVICLANEFNPDEFIPGVFGIDETWQPLLDRFTEGQFVAVSHVEGQEQVIGLAISMKTDYSPSLRPLSWRNMIGDLGLSNHAKKGRWLYGVEKAVHPDFQGLGIGSALYKAQFDLVRKLKLKGMYAGGMLKGFQHHKHYMSIRQYAGKVMRGELFDPTVSVQMKKGFKPRTLIENYAWDEQAAHTGMLIVWVAFKPLRKPRPAKPNLTL